MEIMSVIVRLPQFLFVLIILSLSGALVSGQFSGNSAMNDYLVFCGVWGMLVTFIGIASAFIEAIPGIAMMALDGLTTLFFFAGSIALASILGVHSCSNDDGYPTYYQVFNSVIGGGVAGVVELTDIPFLNYPFERRCRMAQADCAFMFFAMATFAVATVLDIFGSRRK